MTEAQAKQGLAVKHYATTWRDAQRLTKHAKSTGSYWETVRRYYEELGGLRIDQLKDPKKRAQYFEGAPTA